MNYSSPSSLTSAYAPPARITAVLGATNTGKTHYAVERMCARASGVIGLPLRLLAREVYDRLVLEKGAAACALITGEEKIQPPSARFYICTVEAMPMDEIKAGKFAAVIVDEVQMIEHPERGHVFTDRVLHARGTEETLFLGSDTARPVLSALVPGLTFVTRERFSILSYAGHSKLTRLPKRSVVVAFSAADVYAIAELMRRQYGGAALVMGGLSPRTRNAQAAMYQSGEVDYMVATDAIGMGLNLDVDHVAFAAVRKFDGTRKRHLYASELAQIAGRAGRFRRDGTFGTAGKCLPLDDDIVLRIENHGFEPLHTANWRNTALDYSDLEALQNTLAKAPDHRLLRRIAPAPDELALERLIKLHDVTDTVRSRDEVKRLWDICQIPDFRNLGAEAHARLLSEIYETRLDNHGRLPDSYMHKNIARLDVPEGSAEIISSRLANIRTWTYVAHKTDWLESAGGKSGAENWINRARAVEDRLSDALHTKLVQRFVDRRTSALLKGIGAETRMDATITETGEVMAEGHTIGHLKGLLFTPDPDADGNAAKALMATASLTLAPEINRRLTQIAGSDQGAINLSDQGEILWNGDVVGKLARGNAFLNPQVELVGGEIGSPVLCDQAAGRLRDFLRNEVAQKLEALHKLKAFADDPNSYVAARPLANVLYDHFGVINRVEHLALVNNTEKTARGYLRNLSARFGYYHVFLTELMKPGPARLKSLLFAFAWDQDGGGHGLPFLPPNGMASLPDDPRYSEAALNMAGYTRRGPRIIRFDILARLYELIMQAANKRADDKDLPAAKSKGEFRIASEMMAGLGCSHEDLEGVLTALGFEKRQITLSPAEQARETQAIMEAFYKTAAGAQLRAKTEAQAASSAADAPKVDAVPGAASPAPAKDAENIETNAISPAQADGSTENPEHPADSADLSGAKAAEASAAPEAKAEKPADYVPKRQRVKPLHDFVPRAEIGEDGLPIIPTTADIWTRAKRQFQGRAPATSSSGAYEAKGQGRAKSGAEKFAARTSAHQGGAQTGGQGRPHKARAHKGKRKHSPKPSSWSAAPKTQASADSPFAALAALKLDGAASNPKTASKKQAVKTQAGKKPSGKTAAGKPKQADAPNPKPETKA